MHFDLVREETEIEKGVGNEVGVHTGMGLTWICFLLGPLFFLVGFDGLIKRAMVVRNTEREEESSVFV